jgi:hypothetical protein
VGGKHGPISLGKYVEIHETAMRALEAKGYVLDHDLRIERVAGGLLIEGRIHCPGGITVDVTKLVAILYGEGEAAIVQTKTYSYHAQLQDFGALLRYCGPHLDHNRYHHKHTFDVLAGDIEGTVGPVDEDTRPTLAEVITEACDWYFQHAHEVETRRA